MCCIYKKKLTALLLSGNERIQLLCCICITMTRSPSSCCLMAKAVRSLLFAVLQLQDGGRKAKVERARGKKVKQNCMEQGQGFVFCPLCGPKDGGLCSVPCVDPRMGVCVLSPVWTQGQGFVFCPLCGPRDRGLCSVPCVDPGTGVCVLSPGRAAPLY